MRVSSDRYTAPSRDLDAEGSRARFPDVSSAELEGSVSASQDRICRFPLSEHATSTDQTVVSTTPPHSCSWLVQKGDSVSGETGK
jgi:hypothetical protein